MKNDILAIVLQEWFERNQENKNIWNTDVGETIKKNMKNRKQWKNRPRGNPQKGYEKRLKGLI